MMECVRQLLRKQTKKKTEKSKKIGLFLVFHECIAIRVRHKKYHYNQNYLDIWVGKNISCKLPLNLGFRFIYVDEKYENYKENKKLPYMLQSIRILETNVEFNFVKVK